MFFTVFEHTKAKKGVYDMDFIKVIVLSVVSIVALFFSTKIIGNKEMSELSMFDYINSITIGSIAAEMATALETDFYFPLIAIAVYTIMIFVIARLTEKNMKCRRFFAGRSILLMENGKLYQKNFRTAKLDINDFLTQCRINGYFNLDDIDTAVFESTGKISFLPKAKARPATTQEMGLAVPQDKLTTTVILDGHIMELNLKHTGNNRKWLENELQKQKINNINDVFYASCDSDNVLSVFKKTEKLPENDLFQ